MYGYGFYYYDYTYFIYMFITMAVSMYAHFKVQSAFNRYAKVRCMRGMTGAQAAEEVLKRHDVLGVSIGRIRGSLNDHFDPRDNSISLSDDVYGSTSISAIGVAAHEAGHAVQHAEGYAPIKIRKALVPISQFGSSLSMPLVFIGLLLPVQYSFIVNLGIILFSMAVLFQLVTLPVEFDASKRAIRSLESSGILEGEELDGARKVLSAAALTYVAAAFTSVLTLLRLLFIARRRD